MRFDPLVVDIARLLGALGIDADHQGDRWVAQCPSGNHPDRRPSWDIKDEPGESKHGLHSCLSCGFHGTATDLVCDIRKITPFGAREWIKERAMGQAPIPQRLTATVASRRTFRDEHDFQLPPETLICPFNEWPDAARHYISAERNIDPRLFALQADRWHLGYSNEGRLKDRIVIPVYDGKRRLMTYTARTYGDAPKRYLEPKKEEHAHRGAILGEEYWPPPAVRDLVVVTEGAFNAFAVERVTENLPIASLFGATVELSQIEKLTTFKRVLMLTDEDMAGDRAADKIERALARYVGAIGYIELERGEDADGVEPHELRRAIVNAYHKLPAA